jgi:hypothetical protein
MNDRTPILLMEEDVNQLKKRLRQCEENIGVTFYFKTENLRSRRT